MPEDHPILLAGGGLVVYVRDVASGEFWRLDRPGFHPWGDLQVEATVAPLPGGSGEIWRVTLAQTGHPARRYDVTTCGEVVLNDAEAHAAHPVFSKLFLQTEWDAAAAALLVRRRPRAPQERFPWLVHASLDPGRVDFTTDRAAFFGRGSHPARPAALRLPGPLGGGCGNVLDPVVVLRREVSVAADRPQTLTFLLGAAATRDQALSLIEAAGGRRDPDRPQVKATPRETTASTAAGPAPGFANGLGSFGDDGREYVLDLRRRRDGTLVLPPQPWVNVIANPGFGCLVSETGAGTTWSGNSREHRLTPWSNDPVLDPPGDAIYLRDDDSGAFRSCWPGPAPAGDYEVRHGFGYTRGHHAADDLDVTATVFVARRDPVRITLLQLRNTGAVARRLSLHAYAPLVLGGAAGSGDLTVVADPAGEVLLARNSAPGPWATAVAFGTVAIEAPVQQGTSRRRFLGPDLDPSAPIFGQDDTGAATTGADAAFVHQAAFTLAPGASLEAAIMLGEAADAEQARRLAAAYRRPGAAATALAEVRDFWRDGLGRLQVRTPSPALDHLVNGWLAYQTLSCRIWGRTAFYQSGGAFGFRDQLQDALALLPLWPELAREQILLHAGHQFVEGDVLHWWHPPLSRGIRTRFADDLLWLPYLAAHYVAATGDDALLREPARYLTAAALEPDEDEVFVEPTASGETGDVYDHCCRALDRSLAVGAHGLPLFGTGDWNDGMNRVGREGRGESVWMGFFLVAVIDAFAPLCDARGDGARAARYRAHRAHLASTLDDAGWDGGWYLRGFYDDGTPLGSHRDDECRIDALVQAWSVLSGVASPERAAQVLGAVEAHLISEDDGLIRLLTPPFVDTPRDPGYIKGYVAGVRENGGQYTHAALWVVRAMAAAGRRDRAAALLDLLNPILHADSPAKVARYQVEPYVVAADVYGADPHVGRGGWTWYTGSSGWMLRVALESVLGLRTENGDTLVLTPCVPDDWPAYEIRWRVPGTGTVYDIVVTNPGGCSQVVVAAVCDDAPLVCANGTCRLPLQRDGREHRVRLTLGPAKD
jgi:N,N'-diacetylchitobiose phosphorylase